MKAASFFALSLAVLSFGCREREAERSSPTDGVVAATKGTPQIPSKPTGAPIKVATEKPTTTPSGGPPIHRRVAASCAAFSPDGKTLLVGFRDATGLGPTDEGPLPTAWSLQLFDVESGKHLRTLNGHKKDVFFVAFLPDGKTAISAGGEGMFRVWDIEKGIELRAFPGYAEQDLSALLPNGKHLLSYNRGLQLWDLIGTKLVKTGEEEDPKKIVMRVTVSRNGDVALLEGALGFGHGGYDPSKPILDLWDVRNGKFMRSIDREKHLSAPPCFFRELKIRPLRSVEQGTEKEACGNLGGFVSEGGQRVSCFHVRSGKVSFFVHGKQDRRRRSFRGSGLSGFKVRYRIMVEKNQ